MRLKRLELKGFKSFANETVIHFSENVTGIVGPNGSGKSNIVDAMRWVLGEQSSKDLRLEAMSDIIFNGTKKRRKSPYAKVAVVFDNDSGILPTEYSEVEVKRTLDHDGNSEYSINGTKCRLKDIKSLFVDTGIGSNSYAIIALGMVDDILNDTENARRKMFEQAAGISKYKQRKHQSMLKLKSTNDDLERIDDLLHEINLNLKALQRQASKARRYLKIKHDYEEYSIKLAVVQSKHINEKYKQYKGALDNEKSKIEETQVQIKTIDLHIQELKNKNLEKESQVSSAQKLLSDIINRIRNSENEKNITEQKLLFAERQVKELHERELRLVERRDQAVSLIENKQKTVLLEEEKLKSLKEEELQIANEKEKADKRLKHVGADRSERLETQQKLERRQIQNEKELSIVESRLIDMERRTKNSSEKLSGISSEISILEEIYKNEIRHIDQMEKKMKLLGDNEVARKEKLTINEENIQKESEELININRKLDALQNEYKLLKNLVDKLEGFPESIKFLNKQDTWASSAKLFSDILYCEEKYRTAIENYLEPYLSYYVVPNSEMAYDAIALLKGAQKGKAQFFVNAVFEEVSPDLGKLSGLISAIDIVEVDKQFHALMSYLLKDVYILEDGGDIEDLSLTYPDKILLTQDGTIIKDIRRISGGSSGLFEGKRIGRKKNLEKLHANIRKLQEKQSTQEQGLNKLREDKQSLIAADQDKEIRSLRKELDAEYRKSQQSAMKLDNMKEQVHELEKFKKESSVEIIELQKRKELFRAGLNEIQVNLKEMSSDLSNIEGAYADITRMASTLSEKYNNHRIQLIKQEGLLDRFKQEVSNFKNQILDADKTLKEIDVERQRYVKEKEDNTLKIESLFTAIEREIENRKVREAQLNQAESRFFNERRKVQDLERELRDKQKVLQQHQHLLAGYTDKYTEARVEMSSMAERLKVEFDVSMDAILNRELEEDVDIDALRDKVERLRHNKLNFGEVNPMAVEAYEEMKERHDLIVQQKQDIIDAKVSLEKTIKEIESRATEQFMEAFLKIRENFIQVFRSLFRSEDTCDLLLEDENNPLESQIHIVARPKGKKPRSLSQLSGGEKTLTATALLFALYLLKPAPFCIFDEVDAPLDDVNIDKFNNIIKDFSQHSQFIIVTHNKMTMASVDVIYGVYMDEPGVSGVSAVDFRHYEDSGLVVSE